MFSAFVCLSTLTLLSTLLDFVLCPGSSFLSTEFRLSSRVISSASTTALACPFPYDGSLSICLDFPYKEQTLNLLLYSFIISKFRFFIFTFLGIYLSSACVFGSVEHIISIGSSLPYHKSACGAFSSRLDHLPGTYYVFRKFRHVRCVAYWHFYTVDFSDTEAAA